MVISKIEMSLPVKIFIFLFSVTLFCQCESDDRYYRPRMPKKLSTLGIINADDTTRYIVFEKSFQVEYPEENADSLRDLSFTISNSSGVLYSFQADQPLENQFLFQIPDSITFITGEKYFFRAKERDCPEISSEITVPEPPSGLNLLSIDNEIVMNYVTECHEVSSDPILKVISISFNYDKNYNSYYALLVESDGFIPSGDWYSLTYGKSYLEFTVRETDASGFFTIFPGLIKYTTDPCNDYKLIENPAHAYYMEFRKKQDNKSTLVLTSLFRDGISVPVYPYNYRIRLLSIPEEMYMFEKNLYTYERNAGDPFAEPVYLKGNIKGGYGMFAIYRSIELQVDAQPRY
ncbi:MAG: DUF4249 domain-containing protein [Bacteroidales bacterium]|nr:DUF4249 domain-containing protein [Bacteroidales bacterium]